MWKCWCKFKGSLPKIEHTDHSLSLFLFLLNFLKRFSSKSPTNYLLFRVFRFAKRWAKVKWNRLWLCAWWHCRRPIFAGLLQKPSFGMLTSFVRKKRESLFKSCSIVYYAPVCQSWPTRRFKERRRVSDPPWALERRKGNAKRENIMIHRRPSYDWPRLLSWCNIQVKIEFEWDSIIRFFVLQLWAIHELWCQTTNCCWGHFHEEEAL